MAVEPQQTLYYKQSRFTSRLPISYLYTPSHYWLQELESGLFRVGATKFALRMLGDYVEHELLVTAGVTVSVGQSIGWVEGFKAISDIFCVVQGEFVTGNAELNARPELFDTDPYDGGWLYRVRGVPAENVVDVHGYAGVLDLIIERLRREQQVRDEPNC